MIAQVIINSNVKTLNKKFDYNVPDDLKNRIFIGSKVKVPFGKTKDGIEGYVIGFSDSSDYETKDIICILDEIDVFHISLAKWMAKKYFCNVSECIKLMLSPDSKDKYENQKITTKYEKYVVIDREKFESAKQKTKINGKKQLELLEVLEDKNEISILELSSNYGISSATVMSLYQKGFFDIEEKQVIRDPLINVNVPKDQKRQLTPEQENAYYEIEESILLEVYQKYLIHGITGSGKTEVYLQLIEKVLEKQKSALMLVPEISLTPQMINRFVARFGIEKIAVIHSKLSKGQRLDEWNKIKSGDAKIVIGPRSALFSPIKDLGIIIIDEEHDSSYKSDSNPKYKASEVAQKMCEYYKIPLVLGSATPCVSTYYEAKQDKSILLELTKRANDSKLPEIIIKDMKYEMQGQNKIYLANQLKQEIQKNLENKEQTILFLNRRGFNTFLMCKDCGYIFKCPHCDINLTHHKSKNILKCHYCSYEMPNTNICPSCNSQTISYSGLGTQKLEELIKGEFPNASTIRMDIDTTNAKDGHQTILNKFEKENIDILIGTQMVVKGHHFPNVTLVGIINADSSLNMEDFRAREQTYQILTQVAGRAGRENKKGRVIIQTYNPDDLALVCTKQNNYKMLYDSEIKIRQMLKYPPFCNILVVNISGTNEILTNKFASDVEKFLKNNLKNLDFTIFSSMPSPISFLKNRYRFRIIIKGIIGKAENEILNKCLVFLQNNVKNDLFVSFDLDPANMS